MVLAAGVLLLALYWMTPLFSRDFGSEDATTKQIDILRDKILHGSLEVSPREPIVSSVSINPFVGVTIVVSMPVEAPDSVSRPVPQFTAYRRFRYDNMILYGGAAVILLLVGRTFARPRASVPDAASAVSLGIPAPKSGDELSQGQQTVTAEIFLSDQVKTAAAIANGLYDRSTLLIAGGILMAFIGVGLFYVTIPETSDVKTISEYLPRVIRPTGMLVFVEAIAWFLLRQYRVQIEDYKSFYRIYLRRANLLIALKTIGTAGKDRAQMALAAAFLQDDQSGRLQKDETTETIASLATTDPNPVFDLFKTLIAQVKPPKPQNAVAEKDQ